MYILEMCIFKIKLQVNKINLLIEGERKGHRNVQTAALLFPSELNKNSQYGWQSPNIRRATRASAGF